MGHRNASYHHSQTFHSAHISHNISINFHPNIEHNDSIILQQSLFLVPKDCHSCGSFFTFSQTECITIDRGKKNEGWCMCVCMYVCVCVDSDFSEPTRRIFLKLCTYVPLTQTPRPFLNCLDSGLWWRFINEMRKKVNFVFSKFCVFG